MSLALHTDEQVRIEITAGLRRRGVDVITAQEDGYDDTDDSIVFDRAGALGRLLFSQDRDMLREAHRRMAAGVPFPGLVYAHQLNVTIGQCVDAIELICRDGTPVEFADRVEYLPW